MQSAPTTKKLVGLLIITLGFYFFKWASVSRREINTAAGTNIIPTTWLLLIPGANFWWAWQYSQSLAVLTHNRIKSNDTFMFYILGSTATFISSYIPINIFDSSNPQARESNIVLFIFVTTAIFLGIMIGHGFFICAIQRQINRVRGLTV